MSNPFETIHPRVLFLQEHDSIWAEEARDQVLSYADALCTGLRQAGYPVIPVQIKSPADLRSVLASFDRERDLVFNWYEGVEPDAADGIEVLILLDEMGFTYTGSNALAWQAAQDRVRAKRLMLAYAIPTPRYQALCKDNLDDWDLYPAIVKVANDHGSQYLTIESVVYSTGELCKRFEQLQALEPVPLMVAEFIDGREFSVALWGNGSLQTLPLIEADFSALPAQQPHIRTYEAKWDATSYAYHATQLVPASHLADDLRDRIERVARRAYRGFGLRDYGRVDIRLRDGTPYVIDVNANPDITAEGTFFTAAQFAGLTYPMMLDELVRIACSRAGWFHQTTNDAGALIH